MCGHWSYFVVVWGEKSATKGTWGKFGEIKMECILEILILLA